MENYFKIAQSRLESEARGLKPPKVKSSIKEQLLDNPSIHLMKEISEKMKANTATIAEYRKFDELLKKFGTIYEAAYSRQRPLSYECHIAGRPNQNTQNHLLPSA
jgi:hypothetical protein